MKWKEDPVAAGTYAVLSVGTIFIPGAGAAGAGSKVASALAKTGLAVEKLAIIAKDARLANGLSSAKEIFSKLGESVRGPTESSTGAGLSERPSMLSTLWTT
jgi:hypothetical protein